MTRRWVVASTNALQISCLWAVALATIMAADLLFTVPPSSGTCLSTIFPH